MKHTLLLLALLVVTSMVGLAPAPVYAAETPAANQTVETVHLNHATAEQQQALPGVEPALSERIVQYRTEHGPFRTVDQLADVKGISQDKLAKFKKSTDR